MERLNYFVNQHKWPLGFALAAWVSALYMLPARFPIFTPSEVSLTTIDQMVVFSENWVWAYISYYVFIGLAYVITTKKQDLLGITLCYGWGTFGSMLIFFIFPTRVPIEKYPIHVDSQASQILQLIREADQSLNACPSLHVGFSLMAAFFITRVHRSLMIPAVMWFGLIAYSTMATKQHYFWDVIAGAAMGILLLVFFAHRKKSLT